jgi:type IV pilus assembly protein PilA
VVVAIIGILASVGVVAYNGYTSSAQKGAATSNHNSVVKWIQNEWQKCSIGEDTAMGGDLDCVDTAATPAEVADNGDVVTATISSQTGDGAKMDNPYTKADAVTGTALADPCGDNRGNISVVATADNTVTVTTCTATAGEGTVTNRLEDIINLD